MVGVLSFSKIGHRFDSCGAHNTLGSLDQCDLTILVEHVADIDVKTTVNSC